MAAISSAAVNNANRERSGSTAWLVKQRQLLIKKSIFVQITLALGLVLLVITIGLQLSMGGRLTSVNIYDPPYGSGGVSSVFLDADERARILREKRIAHDQDKRRLLAISRGERFKQTKLHLKPMLKTIPAEQRPDPAWSNYTFADLMVVGVPKAGTSQLYYMLLSHPDVTPFGINKEFCMTPGEERPTFLLQKDIPKQLYERHRDMYNAVKDKARDNAKDGPSASNSRTVNGCLFMAETLWQIRYLNKPANRKYFIIYRDPADWLWSAFNFFTDDILDQNTSSANRWTDPGYQYRSPELFHEIIASGGMIRGLPHSIMQAIKISSIYETRGLVSLVGKENVMFIRNEDMLPQVLGNKGGLLDQISDFANLERSGFWDGEVSVIRNCNNNKGEMSLCGRVRTSAYDTAGKREMLPETRELIYILFAEACKIWDEEFGVRYPACLEAGRDVVM